jgi:4'-phosphopantetheinyl transferase
VALRGLHYTRALGCYGDRVTLVQLWRIPLDGYSSACLATLRGYLDDDERTRADGFAFPLLRDRFVVAHGSLRTILGRALGTAPGDVRFSFGPNGKPALADDSRAGFSLSHSDGLAVVAVTSGCAVGVDVEREQPDVSHEPIARQFFSQAEADALGALPPAERQAAFFRGWTRKEALVTLLGLGLAEPVDTFDAGRFTMTDLDLGAGYVGAVVVESPPPLEITRREWVP